MKSLLIFGCGYLGARVAHRWSGSSRSVFAVSRSPHRCDEFRRRSWHPIHADVTQPETLHQLPPVDCVLFGVGFDRTTGHSIEQVYVEGLSCVLDALPDSVQRLVYISSTGVYGQIDGEFIDEQSPTVPIRAGGQACLAAESRILQSGWSDKSIVLRIAGLYGPGRVPRRQQIASSMTSDATPSGFLNLIHVDDTARAIMCVMEQSRLPECYVLSDGHPVLRPDYYSAVAEHLGLEAELHRTGTTAEPNRTDSGHSERIRGNKRVRIDKFLADFDFEFDFPDYRAGLTQIFSSPPHSPGAC